MTHHVHWKKRNKKIIVDPVTTVAGDSIAWQNRGKKPIGLFFPDARLFGRHQDVVLGRTTKTLKVRFRTRRTVVFPYAIYFVRQGRFGEGSAPIIIVKPGGG